MCLGYNRPTVKRPITAVLFDMGSTLSHQNPTREDVITQFLDARGYPHSVRDVRVALLAADTWWHAWAASTPTAARTEEVRQAMRMTYRNTLLTALRLATDDGLAQELTDVFRTSIMRRHNALFSDVMPTLRTLRSRGLRLGIVSNWDLSLEDHCRELGLTTYFDTIVGSSAVGVEKPDPAIFRITLERLAVCPDQAIHVGDMYFSDVVGARRAGIMPILLDRYDLQPEADCLRIQSLQDILPLVSGAT